MRLIDADALERAVMMMSDDDLCEDCCYNVVNVIDEMPTIGGWISVKDRLPNSDDGVVLAIAEYDDGWCEVLAWRSEKTGWTSDDPLFQDGMEVTHWMPLPEPPKEVSGDD